MTCSGVCRPRFVTLVNPRAPIIGDRTLTNAGPPHRDQVNGNRMSGKRIGVWFRDADGRAWHPLLMVASMARPSRAPRRILGWRGCLRNSWQGHGQRDRRILNGPRCCRRDRGSSRDRTGSVLVDDSGFMCDVAFIVDVYAQRIVSWHAATDRRTDLVLTSLRIALWDRCRQGHPVIEVSCSITPTREVRADSIGRRNTSSWGCAVVRRQQAADRAIRPTLRSPGHPRYQRHVEGAFWIQIATGLLTEEAAGVIGVAQAVGSRWLHNATASSPWHENPRNLDYVGPGTHQTLQTLRGGSQGSLGGLAPSSTRTRSPLTQQRMLRPKTSPATASRLGVVNAAMGNQFARCGVLVPGEVLSESWE